MNAHEIHDDQLARMRLWATSNGHHPDTYRRRPIPEVVPGAAVAEAVIRVALEQGR